MKARMVLAVVIVGLLLTLSTYGNAADRNSRDKNTVGSGNIKHVLLLSIDGMHPVVLRISELPIPAAPRNWLSGFSHDDTNVMMLVSNPGLRGNTVTIPVTTMQVAPTILKVLGLNPSALQSVQQEGTETLPKLF
jgi:hypothetical protein